MTRVQFTLNRTRIGRLKMSREIAGDLGCDYWEDFFSSGKGNPWRVRPTEKMFHTFEIIQLYKVESFSVLFDVEYVKAWKKQHQDLVNVILLSEKEGTNDLEDLFSDFEVAVNLININLSDDDNDLYIQFKEFSRDA
jgi:hypothetical protein